MKNCFSKNALIYALGGTDAAGSRQPVGLGGELYGHIQQLFKVCGHTILRHQKTTWRSFFGVAAAIFAVSLIGCGNPNDERHSLPSPSMYAFDGVDPGDLVKVQSAHAISASNRLYGQWKIADGEGKVIISGYDMFYKKPSVEDGSIIKAAEVKTALENDSEHESSVFIVTKFDLSKAYDFVSGESVQTTTTYVLGSGLANAAPAAKDAGGNDILYVKGNAVTSAAASLAEDSSNSGKLFTVTKYTAAGEVTELYALGSALATATPTAGGVWYVKGGEITGAAGSLSNDTSGNNSNKLFEITRYNTASYTSSTFHALGSALATVATTQGNILYVKGADVGVAYSGTVPNDATNSTTIFPITPWSEDSGSNRYYCRYYTAYALGANLAAVTMNTSTLGIGRFVKEDAVTSIEVDAVENDKIYLVTSYFLATDLNGFIRNYTSSYYRRGSDIISYVLNNAYGAGREPIISSEATNMVYVTRN